MEDEGAQEPHDPCRIVRDISSGGPEHGGDFVGLTLALEDGETISLSLPSGLLAKIQMFLGHLNQMAAAKRAERPAEFTQTETFQPFTFSGEVSIRQTDQGPLLVRSQTQEGVPLTIALPREGARNLALALLAVLDQPQAKGPRH